MGDGELEGGREWATESGREVGSRRRREGGREGVGDNREREGGSG